MDTVDMDMPALDLFESRASEATRAGADAFARLLKLAEERSSGQIARVTRFLAACYNGQTFPFDPFELRAVDINISDDMLCCLDALRWARAGLNVHRLSALRWLARSGLSTIRSWRPSTGARFSRQCVAGGRISLHFSRSVRRHATARAASKTGGGNLFSAIIR